MNLQELWDKDHNKHAKKINKKIEEEPFILEVKEQEPSSINVHLDNLDRIEELLEQAVARRPFISFIDIVAGVLITLLVLKLNGVI